MRWNVGSCLAGKSSASCLWSLTRLTGMITRSLAGSITCRRISSVRPPQAFFIVPTVKAISSKRSCLKCLTGLAGRFQFTLWSRKRSDCRLVIYQACSWIYETANRYGLLILTQNKMGMLQAPNFQEIDLFDWPRHKEK